MRLAITGKGGVGKTTVAGLLARSYAAEGRPALAVDADPDANLASALGVPSQRPQAWQPVSRMKAPADRLLGCLSRNEAIRRADRHGCSPYEVGGTVLREVAAIKAALARLMDTGGEGACAS